MDRMEQRISSTISTRIEKILLKNKEESDKHFVKLLDDFENKLDDIVDAKINEKIRILKC